MNLKYPVAVLAALAFSTAAQADVYTFTADDIFWENWVSPFDASEEPPGFRLDGPDGFGLTAFGASYDWRNTTTVILGFAAAPEGTYSIDWGNSYLLDSVAGQIDLSSLPQTNLQASGEDWLASHVWGGNGLDAETAWSFTAPVELFSILGGQITYTYTAAVVPEPETLAMLLSGLCIIGATARRRRRAGW
ncbi:MAG: PEP-CTERM sorting domain-containing protein [Azoarcus sp.]|jgi:hypothetical protein|nr:PEP-CTERM sorting domain-containing protein [Azoarcus sp.]